jgi:hypothetical protein
MEVGRLQEIPERYGAFLRRTKIIPCFYDFEYSLTAHYSKSYVCMIFSGDIKGRENQENAK